jgi:hypothetical protein
VRRRIALGVVLALLAPGCADTEKMHDGPSLPKSGIAVLELKYAGIEDSSRNSYFSVARVDGKAAAIPDHAEKLEFLPGIHNLTLTTRVWTHVLIRVPFADPTIPIYYSTMSGTIEFEAKAGFVYQLRAFYHYDRLWAWIAEKQGGNIIAGRPPPIARFLRGYAARGDAGAQYDLGSIYLNQRRIADGWQLICSAANQAHPDAQFLAGYFYEGRSGILWPSPEPSPVRTDPVLAHMWYSLAASKDIEEAAFHRNGLAERMTPDQIAEAERLAATWRPDPGACKKT